MSRGPLVVLLPGAVPVDVHGRPAIDAKTLSGLSAYAGLWDGPMVVRARPATTDPSRAPEPTPCLPFDLEFADDPARGLRVLGPEAVLATLDEGNASVLSGPWATVLVADFTTGVRWENVRRSTPFVAPSRYRQGLGLARRRRVLRAMAARAAGLQCNGPHTFAAYVSWSRAPMKFYDTRVTDTDVALAREVTPGHRPLSLGFSGRWIAQKGVLDAVAAHRELIRRGHEVTLDVLGGGPLDQEIRHADVGSGMRVVGSLDFATQWVPFVRNGLDLMLLPHPQSDSASTFLEAMSCGVPVVGYANDYWRAFHAEHGAGWLSARRTPQSMADTIESLLARRGAILEARERGLEWADGHTFEAEFGRRVEHIRACAEQWARSRGSS